jgi:hypothetical protein
MQEVHEAMRIFQQTEIPKAIAYAAKGGQALHLHRIIANKRKAPTCFLKAINRGEDIAHLFDQDEERLRKTAQALGIRVILVERGGTPRQHIDLCGAPLKKAIKLAGQKKAII